MKKFLGAFLVFSVASVFLLPGSAMAYTFSYDDDYANWPGTSPINITTDTHGTPVISGADVVVTGTETDPGYLSSITIYLEDRRIWDALFINTGVTDNSWNAWDYMVYSDAGGDSSQVPLSDSIPANAGFYSVNNETDYDYVYVDYSSGRIGHVNGIDGDGLTSASGLSSVTLVENASDPDTLTYLFAADTIALDADFVIGYTPWCANDVFLTPVPEPATMLLFGCGLIGLAGIGRKKFFKKA